MLTATIISKFPEGFVLDSIRKKLKQKNISLKEVIPPGKVTESVSFQTDLIFIMHEMLSHSEFYRIKALLEKKRKRFLFLSRKSSGWNWDDAVASAVSEENKMGAPKAVLEENFPNLIRDFIQLRKANKTIEQCCAHLSKYWIKGDVKPSALSMYLHNIAKRGQCPPELYDEFMEQLARKQQASREAATISNGPAASLLPKQSDNEWEALAQVYAQENAQLKNDIKNLKNELTEVRRAAPTKSPSIPPANPLKLLRLKSLYKAIEGHMSAAAVTLAEIEKELGKE